MSDLDDLLDALGGPDGVRRAAALLAEPRDWSAVMSKALEAMDDETLVAGYLQGHVADVEPRNFWIAGDPEHASVWLGHFDRARFDACFDRGNITAHVHQWSFVTRMLHGSYVQLVYRNDGTPEDPRLRLELQSAHKVGDVYTIDSRTFHCVLAPEPDTVTLVARGPRMVARQLEPPALDSGERDEVVERGRRIADLLADPAADAPPRPGTVAAY